MTGRRKIVFQSAVELLSFHFSLPTVRFQLEIGLISK